MSISRLFSLFTLSVVGLVMAIAPAGASAAVSCPTVLHAFAKASVETRMIGPCSSSTGATVNYDLFHGDPGAPHPDGSPHMAPLPVGNPARLRWPAHGAFHFVAPGEVYFVPGGAAGTTDNFNYAATDDGGANWTVFEVDVTITSASQTVFDTPPASPATPVSASIETSAGSAGVALAGRSRTVGPPPSWSSGDFVGDQYFIDAPPQSLVDPLKITVTIDSSVIPSGTTVLNIFRDKKLAEMCPGGVIDAAHDPCVVSRGFDAFGNYVIHVLTTHASVWDVAQPATADGSFTADVLPSIAISATPVVDFGAVSLGSTVLGSPNPASVRVTANIPYDLSVSRTAFSGGDIPLQLAATVPAFAGAALSGSVPGPIPVSGSLTVGGRASGMTTAAGDEWSPVYTLGPVPFRAAGPTSSTVTYTVVAP